MSDYKIDYGPQGTTLIQAGGEYFLAYTDPNTGMVFYWDLTMDALKNITNAPELEFYPDGQLKTEVEGFITYTEDEWRALEDSGQVWNAGSISDINDNSFIIQDTIDAVSKHYDDDPWAKRNDFQSLLTELIIEDPDNFISNLAIDDRFTTILNEEGYTKSMYNQYRSYKGDELGKEQLVKENINSVKNMLLGLEASLDDDTIEWVANKMASTAWSSNYTLQQLTGATQKNSLFEVDDDFKNVLENGVVTMSIAGHDEVESALDTWLPEELHAPYLADIDNLAGKFLTDPKWYDNFIEKLKDERFAFNNNWDKEIPWQNIYGNAVALAENEWGVVPEKGDGVIDQILVEPDVAKRKEILKLAGLERGYMNPATELASALSNAGMTNVIRTDEYTTGRRG